MEINCDDLNEIIMYFNWSYTGLSKQKGSVYILLLMCFSGVKVWDGFLFHSPTMLHHFWLSFFLDSCSFSLLNRSWSHGTSWSGLRTSRTFLSFMECWACRIQCHSASTVCCFIQKEMIQAAPGEAIKQGGCLQQMCTAVLSNRKAK